MSLIKAALGEAWNSLQDTVSQVSLDSLGEWNFFRTRLGRTLSFFFLLQERDVT